MRPSRGAQQAGYHIGLTALAIVIFGATAHPVRAGCDFWKGRLCSPVLAACAGTAGFAGAETLYECVKSGSSYCAECVEPYADPRERDPNAPSGGGAGVVCSVDGCHFGSMTEGLTVPPRPATPGRWKLEDLSIA